MNFGGGSTTQQPVTTQTQTRDPWIGAQPYLGLMYSGASALQQGNTAGQPYQGPMMAPLNPDVLAGLGQIQEIAGNQFNTVNRYLDEALGRNAGLISNYGITPGLQSVLSGLGNVGNLYSSQIQNAMQTQNPQLQATIDAQNRRAMDAVQSSMSGAGRYGSGMYQDVMARAQAEVADPLLMQDYEARQNRALQATQGLGQTFGQMGGINQQALGQAMGLEQLYPMLANAQYTPAQNWLAGGQYLQNFQQQQLQGQIQQYNAMQNYPWDQLARESAILAGAGNLGGTTVTAQTPLQASLGSRLAGGALLGGSLGSAIPGIGTGLGALGGAAAGAFM